MPFRVIAAFGGLSGSGPFRLSHLKCEVADCRRVVSDTVQRLSQPYCAGFVVPTPGSFAGGPLAATQPLENLFSKLDFGPQSLVLRKAARWVAARGPPKFSLRCIWFGAVAGRKSTI